MASVEGVTTKKDIEGNITQVTINTKKHPYALSTLKELGLIEKSPLEIEVENGNYDSVEACFGYVRDKIKSLPWEK